MNDKNIYLKLVFLYIVFTGAVLFFIGAGHTSLTDTIISIVTFLFALFLAFSISNRQHRFNSIRQLLRLDDGLLVNCYQLIQIFSQAEVDALRTLIDEYLMKQIDYTLADFDKSDEEFMNLYNFILQLSTENDLQKQARTDMVSDMKDILQHRKRLLYNIHNKMFVFEWISLLGLYTVFLMLLFNINDGSVIAIVTIPIVATIMALMLMILQNLDNLRWQESRWIWGQLIILFQQLDLLPYFVENIISDKRVSKKQLAEVKAYRVSTFPNKYPNMDGKEIKIVKNNI
jgi:predicted membrane chloride channel (bestrophin family)